MADEQIVDTVVDDDKPVTEDDLKALKESIEEVEPEKAAESSETQETEEETKESEIGEDESKETSEAEFVKQFPQIKGDTPEEYAKNLEKAYENSTAEAMRLRKPPDTEKTEEAEAQNTDITSLYAKQQMDREITEAWTAFQKQYSQVSDDTEYEKFTRTVTELSNTILVSQNRLATPEELYRKAAIALEWTPETVTAEDKLKTAVKDSAASSKTSTGTKGKTVSKVSDEMMAANRKMYPGKSDAEIREELEPYIQ